MPKFKRADNGYQENVNHMSFFWCLIFGTFYFAYKGIWPHVFISAILAVCTAGIAWLIYPFFATGIVTRHYRKSGWIEVND